MQQVLLGDCLDFLKEMKDGQIDLILTDPPYGIDMDKGAGAFGASKETSRAYQDNWDVRPSKEYFDQILRVGKKVIIFGGNYFTDLLPVNGHWIVWDKVGDIKFDNPFSKCELAWTNIERKTVQKYVVIQQGFVAQEKERFHPTQKPVELFKLILSDYSELTDTVLDPFLGSGTCALACKQLKRSFIGIEKEQRYYCIAKERLAKMPDSLL